MGQKKKTDGRARSRKPTSISISKIDESYNTDKAPDTLTSKEDFGEYRTEHDNHENKGNLQDIPSENSSIYASSKVRQLIINLCILFIQNNATNPTTSNKADTGAKNENNSTIIASLETYDGVNKKPFKATGLLNKSQLKLASYIKANKDVTLQGTKRFTDKSGEYYLKNIQLQNSKQFPNSKKKNSLNNPQNLENCLNNIGKIKKRANKIVTLLPENSLTPIPKKEGINKLGMANGYGKKELNDAQRTAVFIRRLEYATSMKKQMDVGKNLKNNTKKIGLIQEWWKTMFKIIKLQKNMRGFLFRKKLMNNLEHQEKLLQFITEFDNIHNYHLYRQFMENLKKKGDYEKAKLMEKCEDFNEKLDNLERLHNLKNFKNCFNKWKNDTKQKKKEDLDKLATQLNDILKKRVNKNNLATLKKIKDKTQSDEDKLNDKAKEFREKHAKKNFLNDLIKAHRLNKLLSKVKDSIDDNHKKDVLDKLKKKKDIGDAAEKLNKLLNDKMKKDALKDLKTMDFVDKLDDVINKHNDKINEGAKKELMDKLKDIRDKKKAEEDKNKFAISSGVNDFELISDKKSKNPRKRRSVVMTSHNDINIAAKPTPKLIFETSGQNKFSLIAPEKFKFGKPIDKNKKIDNKLIDDQLNDLKNRNDLRKYMDKWKEIRNKKDIVDKLKDKLNDLLKKQKEKEDKFKQTLDKLKKMKDKQDLKEYFDRWKNAAEQMKKDDLDNLAKKLNDILTKAKKESDDKNKKDSLDRLKKYNDIQKGLEKLDDLFFRKPKKDALDTLKKNSGMSEGFRILDKLFKKNDDKNKKDFLDRLKKNADCQKVLEDLNKLLEKKLKKKFMDNLKKNNDRKKGMEILNKVINDNLKKEFMDEIKKRNNLNKGVEDLEKLINNKLKKDVLNDLKNRNRIAVSGDKLEKLIRDKLKRKLMDRLDRIKKMKNATDKLNDLMNNKLKKDAFDNLKNNNNIRKGVDILDKLIKDHNDKLKKDAFDQLKKFDDIAKAADILEKLINKKLKDDTFKKLKTMQFVDILEKFRKNKDDKNNEQKCRKLMNTLKKLSKDKKEEEDKNNKEKLKDALDRWKDIAYRRKIKDDLVDKARKKKAFDHWKNIKELRDILDKLKDKKEKELLDKYLKKWHDKCEQREIFDKLKDYLKKKKAFNDWKTNSERISIFRNIKKKKLLLKMLKEKEKKEKDALKKYLDKWNEIAKEKPKNETKSKRISHRCNSKRLRTKSKKKNDRKLLKQAFDLWRENSSFEPTRNVLEKIKKNRLLKHNFENLNDEEKNDLLQKYKNKMLQVMLNIYKRQRNLVLKRYLDKWRRIKDEKIESEIDEPKYKKKPRIEDVREFTDSDVSSFNPTYYNTKQNTHSNQRNIPYKKRYAKKPYEQLEEFYEETPIKNEDEEYNIKEIKKDEFSDTSSNNESMLGNGEYLIQNKKTIRQPRNYTSQSFFIDKNNAKNITSNNYQVNTHNTNQLPMTMKGDFVSLIEQNPKILQQKNPRIQVTNATCDLNQIINNENTEDELNSEEVNYEMDKLNNNFIIDKNRVLSKVIKNCDKDLYASQRPFRSKKDQWYSVSIPLNDNEAKWEFLGNIKGERDKNNLNKFELIQKEADPIKEENEDVENKTYSRKTLRSDKKSDKKNQSKQDSAYKLREMNYSQFYRSPIKTPNIVEEEEKNLIGNRIKRPGQNQRQNTQRSFLNTSRYNRNYGRNGFDRSRGKINFDPKYRSIDYENGYEFEDSDD